MTRKFLFLKDVYMSLLDTEDGCITSYETVDPSDHYWLELEEDGKLYLFSECGKEKRRVKTTWDMAEAGRFKEVKEIPAAYKVPLKEIPLKFPLNGHDS
jgi:hypothetical protein